MRDEHFSGMPTPWAALWPPATPRRGARWSRQWQSGTKASLNMLQMGWRSGWLDLGREWCDEDAFSSSIFLFLLTSFFFKKMENVILAQGKMSKRTKDIQWSNKICITLAPTLRLLAVSVFLPKCSIYISNYIDMYAVFSIFKNMAMYIQVPFCVLLGFFESIDYPDLLHLFKMDTVFYCMGTGGP